MSEQAVDKKRPDMVMIIALYQFVAAAFLLLAVLGLGIGLVAVVFSVPGAEMAIPATILVFALFVVLVLLGVNVAAGWGLLAMKEWARWLTIVLSVFALPNFPIGTATGVIRIWYLLTPEAEQAFGK